jgi:hypothetical protein
MGRSSLVSVTMKIAFGLAVGCLLLGAGAGCLGLDEECHEVKTCGGKTLWACTDYEHGCRWTSSDGQSWSCTGRQRPGRYGDDLVCDDTACKTAAQEAADWCFSQTTGTAPTAWGDIVVSEIMYDPTVVPDELGEWFEIHNPFGSLYDLFGCEIRDRDSSHTIAAHLIVPNGSFRTAAIFASGGGFVPDYTYSGIALANNDADEVSIWCGSTLIDQFAYTASQSAISGHALGVNADNLRVRLAHYPDIADSSDYSCPATSVYNTAGSGSEVIRDYGTPGAANPTCP